MKYVLSFEIQAGEKTCASKPGEFCQYCTWKLDADKGLCYFFGALSSGAKGSDTDGWLERHPNCLEKTRPNKCSNHYGYTLQGSDVLNNV